MQDNINIEKLLKNYRVPSIKSKEDAWKELNKRLQPEKERTFKIGKFLQIAAVLTVVFLTAVLADSFVFVRNYSSGFAEQKTITLKDNSKVTLNSNTRLKVNYSFITGKRKLTLEGYALFEVVTGKEFSVKFNGGKVTVLGTLFSIETYDDIEPEINCLSGSVRVKTKDDQILLEPGEGAVLNDKSEIEKTEIKEEKVLAEMDGNFSWENERLSNIFKILEIQFGYRIDAPPGIKSRKFTGTINLKDIEYSLEVLSFAMDLDYSVNEQTKLVIFENRK